VWTSRSIYRVSKTSKVYLIMMALKEDCLITKTKLDVLNSYMYLELNRTNNAC